MKFELSTGLTLFGAICIGLDIGVAPILIYYTWNATLPNLIDFVHEITLKQAYILIWLLSFIKGGYFGAWYNYEFITRFVYWYVKVICANIRAIYKPDNRIDLEFGVPRAIATNM